MDNREKARILARMIMVHVYEKGVVFNEVEKAEIGKVIEAELNRLETPNVLTCVYCGQAYPEGTPPHGAKILTDHIQVCKKHPMRKVVQERDMLRKALAGTRDNPTKLEQMELRERAAPAPDQDKINILKRKSNLE